MIRRSGLVFFVLGAHPAWADTTQLGAWFGPRLFAEDSQLGFIPDAPAHPKLENAMGFGIRVGRPFFPWFVPELELAIAPTNTNAVGGAAAADVFWLEPRLHVRFELMPNKRLQPFLVIGGGSPVAVSSARQTFNSGIIGEGYFGGGLRFDTGKRFILRFDTRFSLLPAADISKTDTDGFRLIEGTITAEVDINFGIEIPLGLPKKAPSGKLAGKPADRDNDGVPDDVDQCTDRPEDKDGFQDEDGCPDIDNDEDRVLDIADKCPTVPETYNGFDDDDGCPDTVPADVEALKGTIEGLIYGEAETGVRDSAQPGLEKIAKVMLAHPSIRIVLIGHTDDHEAKQFATPVAGQPPPDVSALAVDLSRARAEAVRQAFGAIGIGPQRIDIEGHGAEEPVGDNAKPKGRFTNRRVEIKLYVPPSSGLH